MKLLLVLAALAVVSHGANIPLTWQIPANGMPYPTETLAVGDTITFAWGGGPPHGVYLLADGPGVGCPTSYPAGPATLAGVAPSASYVYEATTPGIHNLACQVGDHCSEGMIIQIVVGAGAPAPGPVLAPEAAVAAVPGR